MAQGPLTDCRVHPVSQDQAGVAPVPEAQRESRVFGPIGLDRRPGEDSADLAEIARVTPGVKGSDEGCLADPVDGLRPCLGEGLLPGAAGRSLLPFSLQPGGFLFAKPLRSSGL